MVAGRYELIDERTFPGLSDVQVFVFDQSG